MPTEPDEVKIPSDVTAVVVRFADRGAADRAADALTKAGFARGADVPGTLMITVHPGACERDATSAGE